LPKRKAKEVKKLLLKDQNDELGDQDLLLINELEQWINKEDSSALDMAEKLSSSSDEFDKLFDKNKQQH
jgi:hemerythrin-like domain-containing protein